MFQPYSDSDFNYALFITDGFVSLPDEKVAASESFILESFLPFSTSSSAEENVLIRGIGLQTLSPSFGQC